MRGKGIRWTVIGFAVFSIVFASFGISHARPQFAGATGQPCSHCHVSATGGGPLTAGGQEFRQSLRSGDPPIDMNLLISPAQRLLHAGAFLVHILFGVTWVGLFLFILLPTVLRHRVFPTFPAAYLRQMWYGIAVILLVGPFLAWMKTRFIPDVFTTRFGILLIVKTLAVLILFAVTAYFTWYVTLYAGRRYRRLSAGLDREGRVELTDADLSLFTGRGKRWALMAYDGNIYDVTGRNLWRNGVHPGGHPAGEDLTAAMKKAPHGEEVLQKVPLVGKVVKGRPERDRPASWFYRTAYLGILASLVILAVVASGPKSRVYVLSKVQRPRSKVYDWFKVQGTWDKGQGLLSVQSPTSNVQGLKSKNQESKSHTPKEILLIL